MIMLIVILVSTDSVYSLDLHSQSEIFYVIVAFSCGAI